MAEPYLILHKVRGEPAFDIATKIECSCCQVYSMDNTPWPECEMCNAEGFWWIIPTSGHRAHPYWTEKVNHLYIGDDAHCHAEHEGLEHIGTVILQMPPNWPDHYPSRSGDAPKIDLSSVVAALAPQEPVERRF